MKAPCAACPFRRDSLPGWLGDATPEDFMAAVLGDAPMPCHETIDYSDPGWKEAWLEGRKGKGCAGSHVFFANIHKLSRDPSRPALPADRVRVFARPQEFLSHHQRKPY